MVIADLTGVLIYVRRQIFIFVLSPFGVTNGRALKLGLFVCYVL